MLHLILGTMNSGKSLDLISRRYRLISAGKHICTAVPKTALKTISSRAMSEEIIPDVIIGEDTCDSYDYILVDECQFLSDSEVKYLWSLSRTREVYLYGLITDFNGNMFDGTKIAITLADEITKLETFCEICGENLATHHIGNGGLDKNSYKSVCYECYRKTL